MFITSSKDIKRKLIDDTMYTESRGHFISDGLEGIHPEDWRGTAATREKRTNALFEFYRRFAAVRSRNPRFTDCRSFAPFRHFRHTLARRSWIIQGFAAVPANPRFCRPVKFTVAAFRISAPPSLGIHRILSSSSSPREVRCVLHLNAGHLELSGCLLSFSSAFYHFTHRETSRTQRIASSVHGLCRCVFSMNRCLTSRERGEIILLPKSLNLQKTKARTYSFELRVERLEYLAKLMCQRKHNCRRCIIRNYATNSGGFHDAADGDDLAATFFPSAATHARTIEAKFSAAAGEERTHYLKSRISSASTGCRGLKVSAPTLTVTAASGLSAPIIPACWSFQLLWQPRFFLSNRSSLHDSFLRRCKVSLLLSESTRSRNSIFKILFMLKSLRCYFEIKKKMHVWALKYRRLCESGNIDNVNDEQLDDVDRLSAAREKSLGRDRCIDAYSHDQGTYKMHGLLSPGPLPTAAR